MFNYKTNNKNSCQHAPEGITPHCVFQLHFASVCTETGKGLIQKGNRPEMKNTSPV